MEKQMLKAVEIAYRKGLKDGCGLTDINPYLLASQVVAREILNKYYTPAVSVAVCVAPSHVLPCSNHFRGNCYHDGHCNYKQTER